MPAGDNSWPIQVGDRVVLGLEAAGIMPDGWNPDRLARKIALIALEQYCLSLPPMRPGYDFTSAGSGCVCERCEMPFRDHPRDPRIPSHTGEPYVTILCDGRRVKL